MTRIAICTGLCLLLVLVGCARSPKSGTGTPTNPATAPTQPPGPVGGPGVGAGGGAGGNPIVPGGGAVVGGVRGAGFKNDAKNQLSQIGLFYNQFFAENGRGPANTQEFMDYIQRDAAKEHQSLKEGYFILVPNARPASGVVLAYEAKADNNGNLLVVMGDRAVNFVTAQQLQAALGQK